MQIGLFLDSTGPALSGRQLIRFALDVRPASREERLDAYAATFLEPARAI